MPQCPNCGKALRFSSVVTLSIFSRKHCPNCGCYFGLHLPRYVIRLAAGACVLIVVAWGLLKLLAPQFHWFVGLGCYVAFAIYTLVVSPLRVVSLPDGSPKFEP